MKTISTVFAFILFITGAHAFAQMTLTSKSFDDGDTLSNTHVFNGFGCQGKNLSPHLSWRGAPKDTKSFLVSVYDPDAPTGSGWWHWTLFNIPADVSEIAEGLGTNHPLPEGAVQGRTDFGSSGFGGACPPEGDKAHRYIFTVHALNVDSLPLDENASGAMVGFFANMHSIDKASITARYGR